VQHLYYQLLDEKCLQGKKLDKHEGRLREKLIALYGELDNAIGSIVKSLCSNDCLILLSDHGFGPLKRIFHLNLWLQGKGYLKFDGGKGSSSIKRFIPESVKRPLRALLRKKPDMAGYNPLALIDWTATRAYSGSSSEQGVYLNVKGREPYGIVEQGLEYIKLRDELMRELEGAIDPATGERIFELVCPREEIQSGRFIENAADIYIQPTRYEWVMAEEHIGELSMPWHHPWGGFHREEGMFIAAGPMISPAGGLPRIDMTQVMPIILASLGMPIPDWVDSNPPDGLFAEEFASAHSIERKGYPELLGKYEGDMQTESGDTGGDDLLRGLGYIN
jgi:predicted AlkP superfamily phosphohydrolase/phosphomutase